MISAQILNCEQESWSSTIPLKPQQQPRNGPCGKLTVLWAKVRRSQVNFNLNLTYFFSFLSFLLHLVGSTVLIDWNYSLNMKPPWWKLMHLTIYSYQEQHTAFYLFCNIWYLTMLIFVCSKNYISCVYLCRRQNKNTTDMMASNQVQTTIC